MNPNGNIKHGGHGTLTYARWKSMQQRCNDPKHEGYPRYGGAGVKVCDRWQDFAAFRDDMGECPSGMTLDRIKNERGYEPGNCRWATKAQQNQNRPSHAVVLEHGGVTKSLTEWARDMGMSVNTLSMRLSLGWGVERALTQPKKARTVR